MLVLPIKKKWFDMIASGEKKEEYREIKPYYATRLGKYFNFTYGIVKQIIFRNGYSHNSPQIKCVCSLDKGEGKEEWGAISGKKYYILRIKRVISIRRRRS